MPKILLLSLFLLIGIHNAYAQKSATITGQPAQVLFEIADGLYTTFPDDFTRDNPNETTYQYNCKFQNRKGKLQLVYCEGPGGAISGDQATSLASIGLKQKFKLTLDPGFDNGSAKGTGFFFEAKCLKQTAGKKSSYSCNLQDRTK